MIYYSTNVDKKNGKAVSKMHAKKTQKDFKAPYYNNNLATHFCTKFLFSLRKILNPKKTRFLFHPKLRLFELDRVKS